MSYVNINHRWIYTGNVIEIVVNHKTILELQAKSSMIKTIIYALNTRDKLPANLPDKYDVYVTGTKIIIRDNKALKTYFEALSGKTLYAVVDENNTVRKLYAGGEATANGFYPSGAKSKKFCQVLNMQIYYFTDDLGLELYYRMTSITKLKITCDLPDNEILNFKHNHFNIPIKYGASVLYILTQLYEYLLTYPNVNCTCENLKIYLYNYVNETISKQYITLFTALTREFYVYLNHNNKPVIIDSLDIPLTIKNLKIQASKTIFGMQFNLISYNKGENLQQISREPKIKQFIAENK